VPRPRGLSWRIALLVLCGAGCVLAALVATSHYYARRVLEHELEDEARNLAQATANRIETVQRAIEKVTSGLAREARLQPRDRVALERTLRAVVTDNEEVYGAAAALGTAAAGVPYAHRRGAEVVVVDLAAPGYQYERQPWYTAPRARRQAVWSEPYFDRGGGDVVMATYSVPVPAGDDPGAGHGVVTTDVSLAWLGSFLATLPVDRGGAAFIVSAEGAFVAHPTPELLVTDTIFKVAARRGDAPLAAVGRRMVRGEPGFAPMRSLTHQRPCYLAWAPIRTSGWSVGVFYPRDELMAHVHQLARIQLGLGAVGFALLLGVVIVISRSITNPLRQLAAATRVIGGGDLDAPLPEIRGRDEVADLAAAFAAMRRDLRAHVEQLAQTTAARARLESELRVARTIQLGLLPAARPPRPGVADLDLAAVLQPAREVGGDFYDYFAESGRLWVAVGDVADKGVPAALLMAVTVASLRAAARPGRDPAAVLADLNEQLGRECEAGMFVTLFLAVVDLETGACRYASAGHDPALVAPASGPPARVPRVAGPALGVVDGARYAAGAVALRPGDALVLYTDGLTEARDPGGGFFGAARLAAAVERAAAQPCPALVAALRRELDEFAAGAEPADDLALLAFRWRGPTDAPR
jgi:sigma-B regulation protein RsbU (phosphoserine phosphatase)